LASNRALLIGIGLKRICLHSKRCQGNRIGSERSGLCTGAYYKVEVSTLGTLAVVLEELPADMNTRIIILNEADNSLADKITDIPGQKVTVEAKVDAPGWYYIGVMDLNGKSHPDPYAFRVTLEQ
jgi:hypothetical protein